MKIKDIALDGTVRQNPVFRLVLGTCAALAITTTLFNAVGMGLAVTAVLVCSNALISLLRNLIPDKVRIPCFILIIATFTTLVSMAVKKYVPDLYDSLGVFLPLVVVNCLIFARAESFAAFNNVFKSAADGLFMGLGYTAGIAAISFIREFFGQGSLFGVQITDFTVSLFAQPAGGFLVFGMLIALFNYIYAKTDKRAKAKRAALPQKVKALEEGQ